MFVVFCWKTFFVRLRQLNSLCRFGDSDISRLGVAYLTHVIYTSLLMKVYSPCDNISILLREIEHSMATGVYLLHIYSNTTDN